MSSNIRYSTCLFLCTSVFLLSTITTNAQVLSTPDDLEGLSIQEMEERIKRLDEEIKKLGTSDDISSCVTEEDLLSRASFECVVFSLKFYASVTVLSERKQQDEIGNLVSEIRPELSRSESLALSQTGDLKRLHEIKAEASRLTIGHGDLMIKRASCMEQMAKAVDEYDLVLIYDPVLIKKQLIKKEPPTTLKDLFWLVVRNDPGLREMRETCKKVSDELKHDGKITHMKLEQLQNEYDGIKRKFAGG